MPAILTAAARTFLAERRFAVLGTTSPDGAPQLTVMWYDLLGDMILMNTAAGRVKDSNLRRDPRIALCVEDEYRYVTIYGSVQLIEDQVIAQSDILRLARRYESEEKAQRMAVNFRKQHRVTIHLLIERVVENL